MEGLARLDVDLVNVHAAGGIKMMEEAKKGLRKHNAIMGRFLTLIFSF